MSKDKHFIGKVAQKVLIEKEGKVLIVRAATDPDIWELPGGRLHVEEDPIAGVVRETMEELGVEIIIKWVAYVEQFKQSKTGADSLLLAYRAELKHPEAKFIFRDGEIAEVKWITDKQLNDQKFYYNCLNALKAFWR